MRMRFTELSDIEVYNAHYERRQQQLHSSVPCECPTCERVREKNPWRTTNLVATSSKLVASDTSASHKESARLEEIARKFTERMKRRGIILIPGDERILISLIQEAVSSSPVTKERVYDPAFGDDKVCRCGHQYYRHFDTYDEMNPVGCKYCSCGYYEKPETDVTTDPATRQK